MELKIYTKKELANKYWVSYNAIRARIMKKQEYIPITFKIGSKNPKNYTRYLDYEDSTIIKKLYN